MKRTPLARKTPLRPGKPLKRGKPLRDGTRLEREGPLPKRNPKRLAKLRAQQFAEQADICRALVCIFCGGEPCVPHHTTCRGMGGVKGKDEHTVPACATCHQRIHDNGESALPVGHRDLANLMHLTLSLLAERPELLPAVVPEGEENP